MPPRPLDTDRDRAALGRSLANQLVYTLGKDPLTATPRDWFFTAAYAVRERLIERWMETMRSYYRVDAKRVYYFSLEFLTGRLLGNSLINLGLEDACRGALGDMDLDLAALTEIEQDAALGNGGLGRLAACYLDAMATRSLPGYGYGIRYEYGMFRQRIDQGAQVELPDNWLREGNPWEFARPEVLFPVRFGGRVVSVTAPGGQTTFHWVDGDEVMAQAYDTPVPGYGTLTVNNMRLWSARASQDFNLHQFNAGQYVKAVEEKNASENLTKVLYPDDSTHQGRELRLKQQYFFVSASLQDILRRYLSQPRPTGLAGLPDKVAIQLNDTHPAIAIPELMRLLVDVHGLGWDEAWAITTRVFAYTNHTLMPEALETWPLALVERVLPRHLQIIYEINQRFLDEVRHRAPGDLDRLRRLSIIDEDHGRRLRMAHLAIVGSHHVNGVSEIHSGLMRTTIFAEFHALWPGKFVNVTNGITPRRWLRQANPGLAGLITSRIGAGWLGDLAQLTALRDAAADPAFRAAFRAEKHAAKARLARRIAETTGVTVDPASLFDVQVKRLHEYKRQLLNVLHVITRYNRLRATGRAGAVPRTVLIAGKAAPGYAMAKLVIRLIHAVADVVNHDPATGGALKLVFLPDYNVSNAEKIIPAADLSEQISLAGTEASGTGNMKLALNGALTIGTRDGATIEIARETGEADVFLFGLTADDVAAWRRAGYDPQALYVAQDELRMAIDMIRDGYFSHDEPARFAAIVNSLLAHGDHYMLLADYADYVACQDRVDALWRDPDAWSAAAIRNVAAMGRFSADRAIDEYASAIWGVAPVAALQAARTA